MEEAHRVFPGHGVDFLVGDAGEDGLDHLGRVWPIRVAVGKVVGPHDAADPDLVSDLDPTPIVEKAPVHVVAKEHARKVVQHGQPVMAARPANVALIE